MAFAGPVRSSYLAQGLGYGLVFIYLALLPFWTFLSVFAVGRSQRRRQPGVECKMALPV
ncbi:hypothetical protein HMPREF9607_02243 [Cutibacterium modestum HL044PA1]|uniref:ABC transmembrane type-1 domain-containing protein n=1 Tax=Cutibacterium modestum HL044PA1 TaxID=765109 RepID=A0ABN0C3H7_9ACTN|nr:hypothetical protein HMPREF9607_02243 [Cutibacterium modestum HL044PA1]